MKETKSVGIAKKASEVNKPAHLLGNTTLFVARDLAGRINNINS